MRREPSSSRRAISPDAIRAPITDVLEDRASSTMPHALVADGRLWDDHDAD